MNDIDVSITTNNWIRKREIHIFIRKDTDTL